MVSFTLTRKEMSDLMISLTGFSNQKPLQILQDSWTKYHKEEIRKGMSLPAFMSTDFPPILHKIIKGRSVKGLSLGEIASLGCLIEYSTLSATSMQNWVKRDFKEYLGSPREGKKYSFNQAALLFIIEDLKAVLDFESIRQLFRILFLRPERDDDDLIEPAQLYRAYADLYEEIKEDPLMINGGMENLNLQKDRMEKNQVFEAYVEGMMGRLTHLTSKQHEAVRSTLLIAVISVQTCYYQTLARQYFNAALFLDF
jgi:hypothetical protein